VSEYVAVKVVLTLDTHLEWRPNLSYPCLHLNIPTGTGAYSWILCELLLFIKLHPCNVVNALLFVLSGALVNFHLLRVRNLRPSL